MLYHCYNINNILYYTLEHFKWNFLTLHTLSALLRCKSGCGLWNRDRNGSFNIYKIAYQAIHNLEGPSYLCREIKSN